MNAAAVDQVQVEQRLRRHVAKVGGLVGFTFRQLAGEIEFWDGQTAISMATVEALDAPRRCEVVATEAAERFGLGVAFGWIAVEVEGEVGFVAHYWNTDPAGRPVDAALRRRRPLAYCGKCLNSREQAMISRFAVLSSVA